MHIGDERLTHVCRGSSKPFLGGAQNLNYLNQMRFFTEATKCFFVLNCSFLLKYVP